MAMKTAWELCPACVGKTHDKIRENAEKEFSLILSKM